MPSRTVRLPLSWDDPATRLAIERYMNSVRSDAPWIPWNIEFIRRINGLETVDDVYRIVFGARYLVLGLGDVYLGAPVATPLDPRHRLVTTKYNPARTWTAENSVGIGGAYLCIYGMEGPGGYQFVGRTVQVWNRFRRAGLFADQPWSLRFFDQIEWYPVGADELLDLRAQIDAGRGHIDVTDGVFDYGAYTRFLADNDARDRRVPRSAGGSVRSGKAALARRWRVRRRTRPAASRAGPDGADPCRSGRRDGAVPGQRLADRRPARHAGRHGRQAAVAGGDEDGNDPDRTTRRHGGRRLHRHRRPGPGGPALGRIEPADDARTGRQWWRWPPDRRRAHPRRLRRDRRRQPA